MEYTDEANPTSEHNCRLCKRPDIAEDMVACDACHSWFHYTCANVDTSVKDRDWQCVSCAPKNKSDQAKNTGAIKKQLMVPSGTDKKSIAASKTSSRRSKKVLVDEKASITSSARARLELELQIIEEQKQIQELELVSEKELRDRQLAQEKEMRDRELAIERKKIAEDKAFAERKLAEERQFRIQQMAIRKQSMEEKAKVVRQLSHHGSNSRTSVAPSEPDSAEKVTEWLKNNGQQTEGLFKSTLAPTKTTNKNNLKPDERVAGTSVSNDNEISVIQNCDLPKSNDATNPLLAKNNKIRMNSVYPNLFSVPRAPRISNMHNSSHCEEDIMSRIEMSGEFGPSNRQIAARQVMGKELPVFNGDPEEWPIWISNFERSTATCGFSLDENLIRLQRCLKGHALETVRSRLLSPASVPHVIKTLQMRYGRPETLIRTLTEKIRTLASPKTNDMESIIEFGNAVDNLVEHLKNAKLHAHLNNPSLLHDLVSKLPVEYRLQWSAFKSSIQVVDLSAFGTFMSTIVELAYEVVDDISTEKFSKAKQKDRAYLQTHTESRTLENSLKFEENTTERMHRKACPVCKFEHRIVDCTEFKSMTIEDRVMAVQQKSLCRMCLNYHGKWPCKTWKGCGIDGCRLRHHALLHFDTARSVISTSHVDRFKIDNGPLLRILPVTLYGKTKKLDIFAFVDEGSQLTLLEAEIANQLSIDGPIEPLSLQWTGNVKRNESSSKSVCVEISGSSRRFKLSGARTVENLMLPRQSMCYRELADKYPHLRGLPLNDYIETAPKLLIGLDNLKLIVPLKVREGGWGEPVATKCRLGWSVYGCSRGKALQSMCGFHTGGWIDRDSELNELVRDFFAMDNAMTTNQLNFPQSEEDIRANFILENTTKRLSTGGYETGLLWKTDERSFPNSYGMAYRRLCSLEKRLSKDKSLYDSVRQQIREYQDKEYASLVNEIEMKSTKSDKTWYLPLGVVVNPKKPTKIRMIWDAAAKVDGVSLNSALMKGPDMTTSLPAVLFNFRLYRYALTGDIKEMFHRIKIRESDRQYQRFLWRDYPEQFPQVFTMNVATFGSSCSPCSAQYVKNKNANEFAKEYAKAAEAIINFHYVDDYLDSFSAVQEAIQLGNEVKMIHSKGGFELRNFMSNEPEIARRVGAESEDGYKSLELEKEGIQSVLGVKWIPRSDEFTYNLNLNAGLQYILHPTYIPTKREVLRVVMSLFDPLGLISFYLVHGRILMQDIWASGADWDDYINEELFHRWRKWVELLPLLNSLRIQRCYFPGATQDTYASLQIHVFVDASESAYSSAIYFRIEDRNGPSMALVAAKSKVAPLKMLTIPRLELQAAVLGSKLLHNVQSMHPVSVGKRFLWTDSLTVLAWLRSDPRKYSQYIGFRVGEILSMTELREWRYVPSKMNVADDATKWGSGPEIKASTRWFVGAEFVLLPESSWPPLPESLTTTKEELRSCSVHSLPNIPFLNVDRFSRWEKLLRTQAFIHRFVNNLKCVRARKPRETGILTQRELVEAERSLWKQAQQEFYSMEIRILQKTCGPPLGHHLTVSKSSSMYKHWPFMDEYGVIRKRGRITAPWIPYEAKYPAILPRHHKVTFLITDSFHRHFRHANQETIVNEMRQRFEIFKLRSLVARVSRNCAWCKIYAVKPNSPPMAPLPRARLTPFIRPFTFVGLDYFGPVLVKVGRSNVKRWVALFTCLTIRAIHMEVVHCLSTNSCVMAIRRFVSRRGAPAEIFSDNGTNFHGANKQLEKEIRERSKTLAAIFTNTTTRWNFNPPSAPHMGGVWERMVRSVKVAVGTILEAPRKPDDETLETIIIEAEAMINTRPLTYIPLQSADEESLTPNHFLLGCSSGVKQLPTSFIDSKMILRNSWKLAQHIIDGFWRRWLKEYLPVISRRSKWFENIKDVEVGDLVLVVDGAVRNQWTRGRVEKVVTGSDGRVRQAWVRTTSGVLRRPVVKLAVLDVLPEAELDRTPTNESRVGGCDGEYPSSAEITDREE
ncbi:uncharacterized protein LOC131428686 [Malaya genurostris]|uniref:uncharacterized protein LOC131428686 n=1 Tax=Malaya genurostris TaxID=325434 RepID=UPI0026F39A7C|nr:uncharacterized protein LOC131428686 [Malaya genurostris]